jgi:hypothetical protein
MNQNDEMNRRHILYNLEEARDEIDLVIRDLKRSGEYTQERFRRAMAHIVHHTNIAWNGRTTPHDIGEAPEEAIREWSRYPADLEPL